MLVRLIPRKSVCDFSEFNSSQKFDQKLATTYRIPLAYSHTVFQHAMIDVALRKRSLLAEILFRVSGVEPY